MMLPPLTERADKDLMPYAIFVNENNLSARAVQLENWAKKSMGSPCENRSRFCAIFSVS